MVSYFARMLPTNEIDATTSNGGGTEKKGKTYAFVRAVRLAYVITTSSAFLDVLEDVKVSLGSLEIIVFIFGSL
jgi:hypothetical protein